MIALLACLSLNAPLVHRIARVESQCNPKAVGPRGEVGVLQITEAAVTDVNRRYGLKWRKADMVCPARSASLFDRYMRLYATEERIGRPVTDIDRALIWHMGPDGYKSAHTDRARKYLEKLKFTDSGTLKN